MCLCVCVCVIYFLERRFIKHYLFLQPRRVVVVKEPSAVPSTSAPSAVSSAGSSASASTSAAAPPSDVEKVTNLRWYLSLDLPVAEATDADVKTIESNTWIKTLNNIVINYLI